MKKASIVYIDAFRELSNFIPYKFTDKDKLLKLYTSKGDLNNAIEMVSIIKLLPIKIDDYRVRSIKRKALLFLEEKNS